MITTTKERSPPTKLTVAIADVGAARWRGLRDRLVEMLRQVNGLTLQGSFTLGSSVTPGNHVVDVDFVVLARDDYERLVDEAEDRIATEAYHRAKDEERVPAAVVDRLLAGENPIRVWREHRGMTLGQLGARAGLSKGYLSDLEKGKRAGPVETLQAIAGALGVSLEELAPVKRATDE